LVPLAEHLALPLALKQSLLLLAQEAAPERLPIKVLVLVALEERQQTEL